MFILDMWLCRMTLNMLSLNWNWIVWQGIICLVIMELPTEQIMSSNKYDKQLMLQNSDMYMYISKFIAIPIIWSIKWERESLVGSLTAHNIKPILNFLNDFIADFRIKLTGVCWLIHWRNSVSSFSQYTQRKSFVSRKGRRYDWATRPNQD